MTIRINLKHYYWWLHDHRYFIGVLLLTNLIIFFNLQHDPLFYFSFGRVADQGFWLAQVKNQFISGHWFVDRFNFGLLTAPLYSYLVWFVAHGFAITLSGQIVSLVSYNILIIWIFRTIPRPYGLFAGSIIGFNYLYYQYAHTALAESLAALFLIIAFLLLERLRVTNYAASGFLFGVGLLAKSTNTQFIPAIALFFLLLLIKYRLKFKKTVYCLFSFGIAAALPVIAIVIIYHQIGVLDQAIITFRSAGALFYPHSIDEAWRNYKEILEKGCFSIAVFSPLVIMSLMSLTTCWLIALLNKKLPSITILLHSSWIFGGTFITAMSNFQPQSRDMTILVPMTLLTLKEFPKLHVYWKQIDIQKLKENIWLFLPLIIIVVKFLVFFLKKAHIVESVPFIIQALGIGLISIVLFIFRRQFFQALKPSHIIVKRAVITMWLSVSIIYPVLGTYLEVKRYLDPAYELLRVATIIRSNVGIITLIIVFLGIYFLVISSRFQKYLYEGLILGYFLIQLFTLSIETFYNPNTLSKAHNQLKNLNISQQVPVFGSGTDYFFLDRPNPVIHYAPPGALFYDQFSSPESALDEVGYYFHIRGDFPKFNSKFTSIGTLPLMTNDFSSNSQEMIEVWEKI